jgi:hypothetical protein
MLNIVLLPFFRPLIVKRVNFTSDVPGFFEVKALMRGFAVQHKAHLRRSVAYLHYLAEATSSEQFEKNVAAVQYRKVVVKGPLFVLYSFVFAYVQVSKFLEFLKFRV